jgi:hypothetical protein
VGRRRHGLAGGSSREIGRGPARPASPWVSTEGRGFGFDKVVACGDRQRVEGLGLTRWLHVSTEGRGFGFDKVVACVDRQRVDACDNQTSIVAMPFKRLACNSTQAIQHAGM